MRRSWIRNRLVILVAMLALALIAVAPALAQTEPKAASEEEQPSEPKAGSETEPSSESSDVLGTITDISGSVVLVEEDPSEESGDKKGAFTVTGETEISKLLGGDAVTPAEFGDLRVGQLVEAVYDGPVAESYPTQGRAASITILEGATGPDEPGGPITATGELGEPETVGEDPEPIYPITDEESGTSYELISGFVELEPYVGERVTISGVPIPGPGSPDRPRLLNVTSIEPAGDDGTPSDKAELSFELEVEGQPPEGASFLGFIPAEGGIPVPLADPDGDGTYTGSKTVDKYPPGPRPVPPSVEPVSLPVQIKQGADRVIKDFGEVKIDGDKTFSASVAFDGSEPPDPENPVDECEVLSTTPELCEGSGNGGSGGSDNGGSGGNGSGSGGSGSGGSGGTLGTVAGGIRDILPDTGGIAPLLLVGGFLIAGGLLVRRLFKAT